MQWHRLKYMKGKADNLIQYKKHVEHRQDGNLHGKSAQRQRQMWNVIAAPCRYEMQILKRDT